MAASPENVANELIGRLEQAWNEADGRAFGEPFSADANFVDPSPSVAEKRRVVHGVFPRGVQGFRAYEDHDSLGQRRSPQAGGDRVVA